MQEKKRSKRENSFRSLLGLTRRQFIATAAGTGAFAGFPTALLGESHRHRKKRPYRGLGRNKESRTYVFNLSHVDTRLHNMILVAGTQRVPLERVTPRDRARLRRRHPILRAALDEHLTHIVTLDMPANEIQLCYVQRIDRFASDGYWDMVHLFYHLPMSSLRNAALRRRRLAAEAEAMLPPQLRQRFRPRKSWGRRDPRWDTLLPVPVKWARYGVTPEDRARFADPIGEDLLKDSTDHAVALVAGCPELSSGEPDSAAHVQNNIIATQPQTATLAQVIDSQGDAWATQTPMINPDTGEPYMNSQGQQQLMAQWSEATSQFTGQAIVPAVETAKNDTSLGTNITDIDPESVSGVLADEPVTGAIWTLHDGRPTVDQSDTSLQESAITFQVTSQTPSNGYYVEVLEVDEERNVTVRIKNWYVRYLGLSIRYLDGDDQPIALSGDFADTLRNSGMFPFWNMGFNGDVDAYVNVVSPEWVILGMPVETTEIEYTFPMPEEAVSAQILCGGLGKGANPYPQTLNPGLAMTVVFDLALPALFLALAAAPGFPRLKQALEDIDTLLWVLGLVNEFFVALFSNTAYDDPADFAKLGPEIGEKLLDKGAERLDELIAESIAEGEAVEAVEDAVPVIGIFLSAITAVGIVAELAETSLEVSKSPKTYATEITFTHDIEVTVYADPNDPAGFPATATHYVLTATFDGGTPYTMTRDMPGTTVSDPIVETFTGVPYGGKVNVSVGFYSDSGWLAGQGSTGPVDNTSAAGTLLLDITIKENLVPLRPDTGYSHKEIIVLDDGGNHVWEQAAAPAVPATPEGQCESDDGQLCELTGITVSTSNAAVGYAWQAYNSQVTNCSTGQISQLHQFANLSITQDPQSEYLHSGCGFSGTVRIVYDLLGKKDFNFYLDPTNGLNFVRQIRLSGGTADFDGPDSNKAWGRLRFDSDAMLLHPAGRIISINESLNKIEVIQLPQAAAADEDAPLAQVYSGTGIREGLLSGPTHAALAPDGTILILETRNNRIQAFDLGANPVPKFSAGSYFVDLIDTPTAYLDLAVEYTGYLYVLSYTGQPGSLLFRLDIYTPQGDFLARTTGFNAARLAVNYWRDVFALNYQVLKLPDGSLPERTEPSVSHWIPSTP